MGAQAQFDIPTDQLNQLLTLIQNKNTDQPSDVTVTYSV
jgi:hypothetical protein